MNHLEARRVSVTGIDGAGKDTTIDNVAKRLSRSSPFSSVLAIGRHTYAFSDGERFESRRRLREQIGHGLDSHHRTIVMGAGVLYVLSQTRLSAVDTPDIEPELILLNRDPEIDPRVYTQSSRIGQLATRLLIGRHAPQFGVLLDVDPAIALARIEAQGGRRQMHESLPDLSRHAALYRSIAQAGDRLVAVDANRQPEEVSEEVTEIIANRLAADSWVEKTDQIR